MDLQAFTPHIAVTEALEDKFTDVLKTIGEDPYREGLK